MKRFEDEYETTNQIIGQGAFAQVFLARSRKNGDKVAVKMSNSNSAISQKEKQILQQLSQNSHPFVIRIIDIFDQSNVLMIVEEYCSGGTLYELMVKRQKFTDDEAVDIISQVAQGLQYLHSHNIVHRDIKPENVLRQITDNGIEQFKITDFGLSSTKDERMMTTKVGTAYYVAPEILDGRVHLDGYDRTVDIWALGLMFDELLHGKPFYNGNSEEEVFSKIRTEPYFIRDQQYRDANLFDSKRFTIKQVLLGTVMREPQKRKELKQIIQLLEDSKNGSPMLLNNSKYIPYKEFQSTPPIIKMQNSMPQQQQIIPYLNYSQSVAVDMVDTSETLKCVIHQLPLQFKVPDGEQIQTCCVKCLNKYGIFDSQEYQLMVKQAVLEFFTKGFEFYYKPGLFNIDLGSMIKKYQDPSFVIEEGAELLEKYLQIAKKYQKKGRLEFTELSEQIKQGRGSQFITRAMKQSVEGGNCLSKEMQQCMAIHRQEAIKECEQLLVQQLMLLLQTKVELL